MWYRNTPPKFSLALWQRVHLPSSRLPCLLSVCLKTQTPLATFFNRLSPWKWCVHIDFFALPHSTSMWDSYLPKGLFHCRIRRTIFVTQSYIQHLISPSEKYRERHHHHIVSYRLIIIPSHRKCFLSTYDFKKRFEPGQKHLDDQSRSDRIHPVSRTNQNSASSCMNTLNKTSGCVWVCFESRD